MSAPTPLRVPAILEPSIVPGLQQLRLGQRSAGWMSLHRGVRVPFEWWLGAPEWERFVAVAAARSLVSPGTVFCCDTALLLHGYPLGRVPQALHVAHRVTSRLGRHPTVVRYQGGPVAGAPGTLVHAHPEIEPTGGDFSLMPVLEALTRVVTRSPLEHSLPPLEAFLRHDVQGHGRAALQAAFEAEPVKCRRAQGLGVLAVASPASESAGESLSRAAMLRLGVQPPRQQQALVVAGREVRTDFSWPDLGVAGEFDGREKYLNPAMGVPGSTPWGKLRAAKDRDDALRAAGFSTVVHWTSEDLHPITRLRDKLLRAGVPIDLRQRTRLR